jgi:siroheme synthase (precorrin-2 oxidase/ferrochelatase)
VLEFLAKAISKEKEGKQIVKEELKLSLFADNMILYFKTSKDSAKNTRIYNKHLWHNIRIQNQHKNQQFFNMPIINRLRKK